MSVRLLRRSLCLRIRCVPALHYPGHRLYSIHNTPILPDTQASAQQTSDRNDHSEQDNASPYVPPRLYSTPTVKVGSRRKRKQKDKAQETSPKQFDPAEFNARNVLRPKNPITKREFEFEPVESHLAALNAAGTTPSLADLERFRSSRVPDTESSNYPQEFTSLMDKLCRSFSKDQLMIFMQTYDPFSLKSRPNRRKTDYAGSIIEYWGWPSVEEVERTRKDRTEVSAQLFPVTRAELFLILGRDGADLLTLSQEFDAHIALAPEPLALRVEGVRNSLIGIQARIASLQQTIVTKIVSLPANISIRAPLVQQISRVVGAYLEYPGSGGEVKITAVDAETLISAERLVIRTAHETYTSSMIPHLSFIANPPPDDSSINTLFASRYALYPHYPGRLRPQALKSAHSFRLRKVVDVLSGASGMSTRSSDGLSSAHGAVFTRAGSIVNLRSLLFDEGPRLQGERTVKALLGHILINDAGDAKPNLTPNFSGYHSFSKVQEWLANTETQMSFLPSLPHILTSSVPSQQRVLHRLTYEALPTDQPGIEQAATQEFVLPAVHSLTFEVLLAEPHLASHASTRTHPDKSNEVTLLTKASLVQGLTRKVDVLVPDRFMDVRFIVADSTLIPQNQWPLLLQDYAEALVTFVNGDSDTSQPDPPLVLRHGGLEYILHGTSSVRQSTESTVVPKVGTIAAAKVVSESILDLENDEKSTQCEITCDEDSPDAWLHFLDVCDTLSGASHVGTNSLRLDSMIPTT